MLSVVSGQWSVVSRQWAVGSREWTVDSAYCLLPTAYCLLPTACLLLLPTASHRNNRFQPPIDVSERVIAFDQKPILAAGTFRPAHSDENKLTANFFS